MLKTRFIAYFIVLFYILISIPFNYSVHKVNLAKESKAKITNVIENKTHQPAPESIELIDHFENQKGITLVYISKIKLGYSNYIKIYKHYLLHQAGQGPPV